jgi:hypothetical protein
MTGEGFLVPLPGNLHEVREYPFEGGNEYGGS